IFFFFFSSRRRHTRCLSDWSSDVCSSDLEVAADGEAVLVVVEREGEDPGGRAAADRRREDLPAQAPVVGAEYARLRGAAGPEPRSEERRVGKEGGSRGSEKY